MKDDHDLLADFAAAFDSLTSDLVNPIIIAGVSGGPDSLVMMHLLYRLKASRQYEVVIVHVDHQLRPESASDTAFVMREAERCGFSASIATVDTRQIAGDRKISIETAARAGRYTALLSEAQRRGAARIFVAHTRDDQAETVLSHLIRGTGLDGLSGMKPLYPLTKSHLLVPVPNDILLGRPLLTMSRARITRYCEAFSLRPLEDSTNRDETYMRNWIRHSLIPGIEVRIPSISERLISLADIVQSDAALLHDLTQKALSDLTIDEGPAARVLAYERWYVLPLALKRRVLRESILHLKGSMADISFGHIDSAIRVLENSEPGSVSEAPGGVQIYREGSGIIIRTSGGTLTPDWPALNQGEVINLTSGSSQQIGSGRWVCEALSHEVNQGNMDFGDIYSDRWQVYLDAEKIAGTLMLRPRASGDRFRPQGMKGSVTVSDFMTDHRVPREVRSTLPILSDDEGILWVCGFRLDRRAIIIDTTRRVLLVRFFIPESETGT